MNTFHRGLLWVMVCAFSVALILESTANAGRCGNSAPQAAPQRRKGGEAFAPLPLPATPLRRSEKK